MAHIRRQDLKHDEFVDWVDHLWHYLEDNGPRVALFALLGLVGVVSVAGYYWYSTKQEDQANILLNEAVVSFEAPVQPGLPPLPGQEGRSFASEEDKWKMAGERFAAVFEQYPRTQAGLIARHYEGICKFRLGNREVALAILEEVSRAGNKEVSSLAKLHLADFYVDVDRAGDAEKLYRKLIAAPSTTVPLASARMGLAALLSESHPAEARELYEQIKTEFPNTAIATAATQRQELLPEPAPEQSEPPEPPSDQ